MYYAFFYSIATYGLIAWGGAYKNSINSILLLEKKRVINKLPICDKKLLNIEDLYKIQAVLYNYEDLKKTFQNSISKTRHKKIPLPKHQKKIFTKNSRIEAIKFFNTLPNNLKTLSTSRKDIKNKIIEFSIV